MPEQSRKLLTMLSYVISKLDKLEDILDEVAKLAQRHQGYSVKAENYTAVGAAILWTLEQGLGTLWIEELKTAWVEVYTFISEAMIKAVKVEL
jgi:hemoglobin-like flavoprotein